MHAAEVNTTAFYSLSQVDRIIFVGVEKGKFNCDKLCWSELCSLQEANNFEGDVTTERVCVH